MFQAYLAAALLAAQQAATPAPTGAKDQTAVSDVVVQAARPDAVARIDRNVYDIKNDPQAKGAPLLDILGKLPSVSVTPAGRVQLFGASGVTVMIDGKAVSSEKLGAMSGTDVDKVEVMTNPSAQYAAQGSAGIINIVTRKRYSAG
jgi:outer membrane cobalamin receptor